MAQRLLHALYERLGARYPLTILVAAMSVQYFALLLGVSVLALYLDVSIGQFLWVVVDVVVIQSLYVAVATRFFRHRLRPVVAWLAADRGETGAVAAWEAAASLPAWWFGGLVLAPVLVTCPAGALLIVWQLDLPASGFAIVLAGALVVSIYAISMLFVVIEWALNPLLADLSDHLPGDAELHPTGVPVRSRLLVALPAINVVAGVFVASVARSEGAELNDLGVVILVSVAAAVTLSLWFTVLLSRSLVPIGELRTATERVRRGDLEARVPILSADETGELAQSFNRMVVGLQERERLGEAFGAFVDPELVERVLRDGTDLAGEEVNLSVLFMDIRGFTTFSERAEAREVVARLNDLYGRVVPVVLRHGGHANKFIGDGLLAVFGAPDRLVDHADRAVAAAVEIAQLVRDHYQGELRVGIGVNSGPVVSGTIGGGGRVDFTVIGDTVNTAARVESATRQTDDDVLITEATYQLLASDCGGWDERPPVALKGKSEAVRLYAPRVLVGEPANEQQKPTGTTSVARH